LAGIGEAGLFGAAEAEEGNRLGGAAQAAPWGLMAPVFQGAGALYRNMFGSKVSTADQIIADAMEAAELNLKGATPAAGAMLADAPEFRGLAQGVANMTTGTRKSASSLDSRADNMTTRVQAAIREASTDTRRLSENVRATQARQSALASPIYRKAFDAEIPVIPELQSILKTPTATKAFSEARRIAGDERRLLPDIYSVTPDGAIVVNKMPDMAAWDDIKRGFDNVIENNTSDLGKLNPEGRRALILKNEMLGILDRINPDYKKARGVWAGEQSVLNAMENGRRSLNKTVDEVIDMTENLSASERDAMLKGLVADITERMGRRADNTVGGFNFLNNENARIKIMAILGETEGAKNIADNIINTVKRERGFAQTRSDVLGGSQTHIRKQAEEALHGSKGGMDPIFSAGGAARELLKQVKKLDGISKTDAEDLAAKLFDPDMTGAKLEAILKDYKISEAVKQQIRSLGLGATAGLGSESGAQR
jgi:hypothetical protein